MSRPAAAAGLLDALRAAVPERIRRRLDAGNPAESWVWTTDPTGTTVTTDGGERVTVAPREGGATAGDLACTCLLAPRCLHVLAVAAALPAPAGATAPAATAPEPVERPAPPEAPPAVLDAAQRSVITTVARCARQILAVGALGAGATAVQDLARAVHASRAVSLHRLARAGSRVSTGLADLRGGRPQFALSSLTDDLRELLSVAHLLQSGQGRESDVGTARRAFAPAGTLRLHGIACEPVAAATGHGGISTLLVDSGGRLFTLADVRPGGPARARASYEAPAQIGGATLTHRDLARHGLFVQNATRSADGRLGMGEGVRAVRAGLGSFEDGPIAARFAEPLAAQLANREPAGWLFVTVQLHGAAGAALVATVPGHSRPIRLTAPTDHAEFAYVDNLRTLARAPGLTVRIVARPAGHRRTLAVLAAAPAPEDPRLRLPAEWGGRVNLGYDRLVAAHFEALRPREVEVDLPDEEVFDPLAPFRRRVERMVLGGRGTLPGAAGALVEREVAALGRLHLGGGAELLATLFRVSNGATAAPTEVLANEWLRAATWIDVVDRHLQVADWRT